MEIFHRVNGIEESDAVSEEQPAITGETAASEDSSETADNTTLTE